MPVNKILLLKFKDKLVKIKCACIRWVKTNAEKYGIDTSKIAVSGCSAGGQLAALVGIVFFSNFLFRKRNSL